MLSSLLSCSLLYPKLSNFSVSFIRFWWRFSTFFALCNKLRKLCLALLYHWNLSVRSSIVRTLFSPARFPFLFVPLHIVFVLSHCFSFLPYQEYWSLLFLVFLEILILFSGDGSHHSNGDERTTTALARAVTVHSDTNKVMYFAWSHACVADCPSLLFNECVAKDFIRNLR